MEVKKIIQQQNKQKTIKVEDVVVDYYVNRAKTSENSVQKYLKSTNFLNDLEDHTETGILACLNKRIGYGIPYTFVGKDLVSIRCDYPGVWYFSQKIKTDLLKDRPHPYGLGLNAYLKLKETQENQVLTMVGASGTGKTFHAIHILDHILSLSTEEFILESTPVTSHLFDVMHRGMQLLHIMGSVIKKHNSESTSCAFDLSIHFDKEFRSVSGKIQSTLLDISLPSNKKGRTYQLLHSIIRSDKNTLKVLGICQGLNYKIFQGMKQNDSLRILDIEVNQRFFENLNFIGVTNAEKKEFLELLSCVIHLYEIEFVKKNNAFEPKNRSIVKKVCKMLGLQDTYFIEKFAGFSSVKECENRVKDLSRSIYSKAFEWLNNKINLQLVEASKNITRTRLQMLIAINKLSADQIDFVKAEVQPVYTITILDFPGFTKEKSLSGIGINLAFELLNYYICTDYIKLLKKLSSQQITVQSLSDCKSKSVVESFMRNDCNFMHNLTGSEVDFKKFKQLLQIKDSESLGKVFSVNANELHISYSWVDVNYNFLSIREEALQHYYQDFNKVFLKASSSQIVNSEIIINKPLRLQSNFEENYTTALRKILMPYLYINPMVIYCIKTDGKAISKLALQVLRKSQIIPNLLWDWFGFPHWISLSDLIAELGISVKMQSPQLIKQEIQKKFGWKSIIVTEQYALLKESQMKDFKDFLDRRYRTPEQSLSDLSMSLSLYSSSPVKDFTVIVHEELTSPDAVFTGFSTVIENEFKWIDIDKHFSSKTAESTREYSIVSNGSLNSTKSSILVVHPTNNKEKNLQLVVDCQNLDYYKHIDAIVKIQKLWRGHATRIYVNTYRNVNNKAIIIQKFWRGFTIRKQVKPLLALHRSALKIQKLWKKYMTRRSLAARKIQKWYIRIKQKSQEKSKNRLKKVAKKIMKKKPTRILKKQVKKKIKSQTPPNQSIKRSYSPIISENSKTTSSKSGFSQFDNLSLIERFKILEANRQETIHKKRQAKIEAETFSHTPQINSNDNIKNTFKDRQEVYMQNYKAIKDKKPKVLPIDECSFAPSINKSFHSRDTEKTVQDLYMWAQKKDRKITEAREAKEEAEKEKLMGFTLSSATINYSLKRRNKLKEVKEISVQIKRESSPYWPIEKTSQ